jgi:hypothetical protein
LGFRVPAARGGEINHQLIHDDVVYPVIRMAEPRSRWLFLARCTRVRGTISAPYFVAVLAHGQRLPLPPSRTATGHLAWITEPSHSQAGIPGIEPLLTVIGGGTP